MGRNGTRDQESGKAASNLKQVCNEEVQSMMS